MGGILLVPVRQDGPDGKPRLYTLTVPILEAIYKVYSRNEGLVEPVATSNAETQTRTGSPPPIPSELIPQPNEVLPLETEPTSTPSSFNIPAITLSPPPENIELNPVHTPLPSSSSSHTPKYDEEELLNYACTSTSPIPRRPVTIPLPDIDSFAPPPEVIEGPIPPPRPQEEEFIDLRLEDADLGPILAAVHANLPSCLPVLRSRDVPDIPATKPLVRSRTGHIASTFLADPVLAALLALQLVWFLSGCLARIVLGGWRELLLLEVVVLAYVAMYMMMIVAWWDKPAIGVGAEAVKVVVMGEVPYKRRSRKDVEEEKKKKRKRGSRSKEKVRDLETGRSDKGKGVDRTSGDGEDLSRLSALHTNAENNIDSVHLQVPERRPRGSTHLRPPEPPSSPDGCRATAPAGDATPPHTTTTSSSEDDTIIMMLWNAFVEHWRGYVYFHLDRVFELCLKATGYDRWSREYRVSTNILYSNAFASDSGAARTWREGRRHRRRVQAGARRTVGLVGGTNPERESASALVGADGYPFHYRGGTTGRSGRAVSDEESGVNAEVRRRREAGSGGQSRMATFYTFVPEVNYHGTLWEGNVKLVVGALCAGVFGGIHLLGVAFRDVQGGEGSVAGAFAKGNPSYASHVFYLICTVLLVVCPLSFAFCGLKLSDKYGYEDRIEMAITMFLLELLAIPLLFAYIPARVGVVVVALLQVVWRVDEGLETAGQVLGSPATSAFDGFNPVGAWWLDFVPHFS
jgi:hypothetical protein